MTIYNIKKVMIMTQPTNLVGIMQLSWYIKRYSIIVIIIIIISKQTHYWSIV